MRLTRGLSLVSHLRLIGAHPDDDTSELVDNKLLADTIYEYAERLIQFEKMPDSQKSPVTYEGGLELPSLKNFFTWGLAVMLDDRVHDIRRGIALDCESVQQRWPGGPDTVMDEYLARALNRVPMILGGENLINQALSTDWEQLGFRCPFQFAQSYLELDLERVANSFTGRRPTRQRIFSYALPVGAAAFGLHDEPLAPEERQQVRTLQRKLIQRAMGKLP